MFPCFPQVETVIHCRFVEQLESTDSYLYIILIWHTLGLLYKTNNKKKQKTSTYQFSAIPQRNSTLKYMQHLARTACCRSPGLAHRVSTMAALQLQQVGLNLLQLFLVHGRTLNDTGHLLSPASKIEELSMTFGTI